MNISEYFDAVSFADYSAENSAKWKYLLGREIEKSTAKFLKAKRKKADIIVFGVNHDLQEAENYTETPDLIRKELYQLAEYEGNSAIVDLGNIKKSKTLEGTYWAIRDVAEYVFELNAAVVLIGGSQDLTIGLTKAFRNNPFHSLSCIDSVLDIKISREKTTDKNYLTEVFKDKTPPFQLNLLGYQSHLFSQKLLEKIKAVSFNYRLGLLQENIARSLSVFRNSDVVSLDMDVVKTTDSPGNRVANPNGMLAQEVCELAKYAGFSDRVKAFGVFGATLNNDTKHISVKLAAQTIWYFMQGCSYRTYQFIKEKKAKITYRVEIDEVDNPLLFYKDDELEQWWIKIPGKSQKSLIVACDEDDYLTAKENQIPEIYLKYLIELDDFQK